MVLINNPSKVPMATATKGLALLTAAIVTGVIGVYCIIFYKDTTVKMIRMVKYTILRKKAR